MDDQPAYRDATLPPDRRATDLLGRMTVREKIGQLLQPEGGWKAFRRAPGGGIEIDPEWARQVTDDGIGSIFGLQLTSEYTGLTLETGCAAEFGTQVRDRLQRLAREGTRLGIPLLFAEECPHGHLALGATVFPTGHALGHTWDAGLLERVGRAIGEEAGLRGADLAYGPVLDLAADARWGRCEECLGEDPVHATLLGTALVRGMIAGGVVPTLKHFAGHGANQGGRNLAPVSVGERELRAELLRAFRAAVAAGAGAVMTAYNEVDGVPATANRRLLTGILRDEWGFGGVVVSDGRAVDQLAEHHHVAADLADAAAQALKAGVDICVWGRAFHHLQEALDRSLATIGDVDRAVHRVLTLKFRLGLFDRPYAAARGDPARVGCREHRALAREAADKSLVLLTNAGVLPVAAGRRIALIGPNADAPYHQLGDYTALQAPGTVVTLRAALAERLGVSLSYAPGCRILGADRSGFPAALAAAAAADVVVLALGGCSSGMREFHADRDCGEGFDRTGLRLGGEQEHLLRAVATLGKPVVLVLIGGRPFALDDVADLPAAILTAGYPGAEGGAAIADCLLGRTNPGGRLAMSWPRTVGQMPMTARAHRSLWWSSYIEDRRRPRFAFGHGLSYTTFVYRDLRLDRDAIAPDGTLSATVEVVNTGARAGDEVVLWQLDDEVASVGRPERILGHAERITLAPGEARRVGFTITAAHLAVVDREMRETVEPGWFTLFVGGQSARFQVQ
jgi:beta-glucosidase